jgi:gelsolin
MMPCADEGGHGAGTFLAEFGVDSVLRQSKSLSETPPTLYRLSDSSGDTTFESAEPVAFSTLSSSDAFLLDHSSSPAHPAIYVWIGKSASLTEQRLAVQYAQTYAHKRQSAAESFNASVSLVKMNEGNESDAFIHAFNG